MAEENYTPQAQNLMNNTIEDFEEELLEVKASDANLNVLRGIRINIQGKPRRLVDVGDIKKTDTKNYIQVLLNLNFQC